MLQILLLERNDFDGLLPDLSGMRNLEVLFLYQNSFTGAIPTFFGSRPAHHATKQGWDI